MTFSRTDREFAVQAAHRKWAKRYGDEFLPRLRALIERTPASVIETQRPEVAALLGITPDDLQPAGEQ